MLDLEVPMSTVFGVPTHPLIVHAAVVLIPLAASALVATGWRRDWRKSYALPIALIAIAGALAAILASSTGEELQQTIRDAARAAGTRANFGDHPEQGDTARLIAFLFAAGAASLWASEQWGRQLKLPSWAPTVVYGVSSAVGIAAIATIVIAGHSGAALVWRDVGTFVKR